MTDHGVVVPAPFISLKPISGVEQPEAWVASARSLFTEAGIVAGSAGAAVVPTHAPSFSSKKIVCAPWLRRPDETAIPEVAAMIPGLPKTWLRKVTEPSA